MIVEIGDFKRFLAAKQFSEFIGFVPCEKSSDDTINRYGITKAGNRYLSRLLLEASQSYTTGAVGKKSATLKKRQKGCTPEIIAMRIKPMNGSAEDLINLR